MLRPLIIPGAILRFGATEMQKIPKSSHTHFSAVISYMSTNSFGTDSSGLIHSIHPRRSKVKTDPESVQCVLNNFDLNTGIKMDEETQFLCL